MKYQLTPHFYQIIFHPSRTFNEIFKEQNGLKHIVPLLLFGSIGQVCYRFWDVSKETYLISSFFTSSLIALLIGWVGFLVFSLVLHYSCKLVGGSGSFNKSITIVAWSLVPSIVGLLCFLICIIAVDKDFVMSIGDIGLGSVNIAIVTVRSILGLAAFFILISGISTAYKLTFLRSLVSLIIPILLFLSLTFSFVLI